MMVDATNGLAIAGDRHVPNNDQQIAVARITDSIDELQHAFR
jgi:hypothetical protein